MQKINVVGTSGSGKSTFSRQLADKLRYPHVEMDALFWKANWQESSDDEFFAALIQRLERDCWVLDGNYNRTVPIKWSNVDTVIWIDYSFSRTVYQAVTRALVRSATRKEIWPGTGNVETFRKSFFSKESVVWWSIKHFHRNRERYQAMSQDPQFEHIRFVRLTSPKMAQEFIHQQA
ncbi:MULTISPECIES: shikimate kinase [Vibrio]|nr:MULTISPECIES: shikimate kinase [Vibrio]NAW56420.1 AAA family ATPase [Vibrio sp. V36_P2S2PM302]NAX21383.1 AAA family ATPase [Vibrio sp. V39_P1S14PM300]NAX28116.1 AAA family ATPase [Vibrio sp. V38_P2S17PM301]NAX32211.1 AAA family ATPase [Vibrio sp. V37_P2S8PM304]